MLVKSEHSPQCICPDCRPAELEDDWPYNNTVPAGALLEGHPHEAGKRPCCYWCGAYGGIARPLGTVVRIAKVGNEEWDHFEWFHAPCLKDMADTVREFIEEASVSCG